MKLCFCRVYSPTICLSRHSKQKENDDNNVFWLSGFHVGSWLFLVASVAVLMSPWSAFLDKEPGISYTGNPLKPNWYLLFLCLLKNSVLMLLQGAVECFSVMHVGNWRAKVRGHCTQSMNSINDTIGFLVHFMNYFLFPPRWTSQGDIWDIFQVNLLLTAEHKRDCMRAVPDLCSMGVRRRNKGTAAAGWAVKQPRLTDATRLLLMGVGWPELVWIGGPCSHPDNASL